MPAPVLKVCAVIFLLTMVASALAVRHEAHSPQIAIWTVVIGVGVFLSESFPINIPYRRQPTRFSMFEVPVLIGIVVLPGWKLLVAVGVGVTLALTIVRRLPWIKVSFNVPNMVLHASGMMLVFDVLADDSGHGARTVMAALVAGLFGSVLASFMIGLVIWASEGSIDHRKMLDTLGFSSMVGVTNAALAVIALKLVEVEMWSVLLLAVPLGMALGAYRAFVSERHHREQLQFLLSATKSLTADLGRFDVIEDLLSETADMFRASRVELFIFDNADAVDEPAHASLRNDRTTVVELDTGQVAALRTLVDELASPLIVSIEAPSGLLEEWMHGLGITQALVQPLRSEATEIGLFVVADAVGAAASFAQADLELFTTLGYQVATALENDRLGQALTQLKELEGELSHQAVHDPLTGLPNRLGLRRHLEQVVRDRSEFELLFIDLDDFKLVNDTQGHASGDRLLVEVADRIRSCLGSDDFAARLGGDEFAVCVRSGSGYLIGTEIVGTVSKPILVDAIPVTVGCSIGVASSDSTDVSTMFRRADVAMYAAKGAGKNRVERYTDRLGDEIADRQQLLNNLHRALDENELRVYYQPIYGLADRVGAPVGAEALVRWASSYGIQSAGAFLAIAEESGLITLIDRWVYTQVMKDHSKLSQLEWVSVNLSARHLQEADIVEWILGATADAGVDPSNVVLEVTETATMTNVEASIEKLAQLRDAGFGIALDDFGTGYSSIAYLSRLPITIVKIAQPFVSDLGGAGGATIVRAMIDLSHTLGLPTVAEGVETPDQLVALRSMGCDRVQGYLLARPGPLSQLTETEQSVSAHA